MVKYPKLQDKSWLEGQLETKTMREIAAELGCSYSGVHWAVIQHNITPPKRQKYHVTVDKSTIGKKAYEKMLEARKD